MMYGPEDTFKYKSLSLSLVLSLGLTLPFFTTWISTAEAFDLQSRVKEFTLNNGLKTIVLERKGSPTFAIHMSFLVGSVEEQSGYTGTAHMLEHMLFKGTTTLGTLDWGKEYPLLKMVLKLGEKLDASRRNNAPKDLIDELVKKLKAAQAKHKNYVASEYYSKLYSSQGGVGFNAGTSKDTTTYIIRLPSNKLELWAWIESERMRDAVFREYFSERDVVREERRRSYENKAFGKLYERYLSAAFIAHPYGRPIIGWDSDIARLPLSTVNNFFKTWYSPNNAVIAIVGDVKFEQAKSIITKYFSDLPAKKLPDRMVSIEPPQNGERRVQVEFDANPILLMGFHKPTLPDKDDYVFDVINSLLSGGRTSRFSKELIINKKVALSAETFTVPGSRYPNLCTVYIVPRPHKSIKDVEKEVWAELDKLKNTPVTKKELKKVVNNLEAGQLRDMVSNYSMARQLAHYQQITGDWRYIMTSMNHYRSITPEQIQRVARKYFKHSNVTVATLKKKI